MRLTDVVDVTTKWPFVRCDLGHDEATDRLVAGVDVLIHLAASYSEYAESTTDNSEISANRLIDYHTRCTYNLLHAASQAGVPRCVYASSLRLFAGCEDDWANRRAVAAPANYRFAGFGAALGRVRLPRVCAGRAHRHHLFALGDSRPAG